jgi:hypothetical protein
MPVANRSRQDAALIESDNARLGKVIRDAGVKAE